MTLVKSQPTCGRTLRLDATMTGYVPLEQSVRTKAGAASGFSLPNGPNISHGLPGFSLNQTEPTQGQDSGQIWKVEGQQYLHLAPATSQGTTQNGFYDSFSSFHDAQEGKIGQYDLRGSFSGSTRSQWDNERTPQMECVAMSRDASQDSIGNQSQRTANSFDQSRSVRMYPDISQMSYHMSSASSDVTVRSNSPESSAMCTPTQQMEMQVFDSFPYTEEDFSGANPMYRRGSTSSSIPLFSLSMDPSYNLYSTAGSESYIPTASNSIAAQGPVPRDSMMYQAGTILESHTLWDNGPNYLDSQRSSPTVLEDPWPLPTPRMVTSATNSPFEHSPSIEGISPRVMRKPIGPRASKVNSDLAARGQLLTGTPETSDESFKLGSRPNVDLDNTARDHHLYHNVVPQADGLYHCPWENDTQTNCQHKPEKLKCNYDKFVDSHLKPYKCKVSACKDLQFSSTACLLRHEREAHGLHGHGEKPFLCTYDSCERGVPGNGFPRHWNLRDHMKRVHNDPGQPQDKSNASASPPPSGSVRSKKRKAASVEPSIMDKAPKRIATPPVVVRQPQEPSLIDRYQEKHQSLQTLVSQLYDPTRGDNMALLRNATDCIKVMAQTTQRINAAPVMGQNIFTQQSG